MSFLQSPRLARRPRISAARSAAWRLLARRRRHRRPDPAFAKQESATAASRRRERVARLPVGAAPTRQGIKTSPKCQRESTAETPNVMFTEPPTGAATPDLGGSICGLAPARPPPTAPAPSSPRSGIREKGIGDGGQQAAPAGRSVACQRGADPTRDKDQPEMSERKHGGDVLPSEPTTATA